MFTAVAVDAKWADAVQVQRKVDIVLLMEADTVVKLMGAKVPLLVVNYAVPTAEVSDAVLQIAKAALRLEVFALLTVVVSDAWWKGVVVVLNGWAYAKHTVEAVNAIQMVVATVQLVVGNVLLTVEESDVSFRDAVQPLEKVVIALLMVAVLLLRNVRILLPANQLELWQRFL